MLQSARNNERERYYLLAGMGGRAAKRKHKLMLQWAIATGLFVSVVLALVMYLLHHHLH
jgi:hypothetical protein